MVKVAIAEAPARLLQLVKEAVEGEEVVITLEDGSAVELVHRSARPKRRVGSGKGLFVINEGFYEPLDDFKDYER
jgi:antitoxin (DNA-binding transcriptional repressor) of toxin-antitoxin stability system